MDVFSLVLSLSVSLLLSFISARSFVYLVDSKCYLKYAAYEHEPICCKLSAQSWTGREDKSWFLLQSQRLDVSVYTMHFLMISTPIYSERLFSVSDESVWTITTIHEAKHSKNHNSSLRARKSEQLFVRVTLYQTTIQLTSAWLIKYLNYRFKAILIELCGRNRETDQWAKNSADHSSLRLILA